MRRPRPTVLRAAVLAAAVALSGASRADDSPRGVAGALYDRGAAAQARGAYGEAARLFTRADDALPNDVALGAALHAALLADDVALGMELAERAAARALAGRLATLAADARRRFSPRAGRVRVTCAAAPRCAARIDGSPAVVGDARWTTVGRHRVDIDVGDESETRVVVVEAGRVAEVAASEVAAAAPAPRPARAPAPARDDAGGLSPGWFWVGAGLTAAGAVGTAASFADTAARHREFVERPTAQGAAEGEAAQARTGALLGVTVALLVATTVVGAVFVRWRDPPARGAASAGGAAIPIGIAPGGAGAALRF